MYNILKYRKLAILVRGAGKVRSRLEPDRSRHRVWARGQCPSQIVLRKGMEEQPQQAEHKLPSELSKFKCTSIKRYG